MRVDGDLQGVRGLSTKSPARASRKDWNVGWVPSDQHQHAVLDGLQGVISTGKWEQASEVELPVAAARRESGGRKHEHPWTWRGGCRTSLAPPASAVPVAARWDKMIKL